MWEPLSKRCKSWVQGKQCVCPDPSLGWRRNKADLNAVGADLYSSSSALCGEPGSGLAMWRSGMRGAEAAGSRAKQGGHWWSWRSSFIAWKSVEKEVGGCLWEAPSEADKALIPACSGQPCLVCSGEKSSNFPFLLTFI